MTKAKSSKRKSKRRDQVEGGRELVQNGDVDLVK